MRIENAKNQSTMARKATSVTGPPAARAPAVSTAPQLATSERSATKALVAPTQPGQVRKARAAHANAAEKANCARKKMPKVRVATSEGARDPLVAADRGVSRALEEREVDPGRNEGKEPAREGEDP